MAARTESPGTQTLPPPESVDALEARLAAPTPRVVEALDATEGDILILGAGGKMGPTLALLAAEAARQGTRSRRIIAVSGFSQRDVKARLQAGGVETVQADLLAPGVLDTLPDAANVIYMAGRKFGSTGAEWATWSTNVYLAGAVAQRYRDSRIVAFSSGNVYPFVPIASGGATETAPPEPVGEYAMSCLGRERMFDWAANAFGTRVLHYRLNYAAELRYGVLTDVATQVWQGEPVDVSMGHVNVVWQGYANGVALQALALAESPAAVLNVTGPELVSIRWLAERFGAIMNRTPQITGEESATALLSNASRCHRLFGYPEVPLDTLVEWVAHWVMRGGGTLNKPTHFQTRDGKF